MDGIAAALRDLLDTTAGIAVTDPAAASPLWPQEAAAIAKAIPRRLTEFAAGRRAARSALAQLGLPPTAIPQAPDRAPIWPSGVTGSISHCARCCVAVAAQRTDYETLGVDVTPATPLDPDLIALVCTPVEHRWVTTQPQPHLAAKLIFCAKEAVYKAQYQLTGKVIGFHAVSLKIDNGTFETGCSPALPTMKGGILVQDGLILSVAHV